MRKIFHNETDVAVRDRCRRVRCAGNPGRIYRCVGDTSRSHRRTNKKPTRMVRSHHAFRNERAE